MTYPRPTASQARVIAEYRAQIAAASANDKPVMQSLYIDLSSDPSEAPQPIHLGYRLGVKHLNQHLKDLEEIGVNHVALNLRFNKADVESTLRRLADGLLGDFQGNRS